MAADEARSPLSDADQQVPSIHFTGFTGWLLVLDRVLFIITSISYAWVLVWLMYLRAFFWSFSLAAVVGVAVASTAVERACFRSRGLWDRSVLRFVYSMPISFIAFYAGSVSHEQRTCWWYLHFPGVNTIIPASFLYLAGWLAMLSSALGALKIDCNASPTVSKRVRTRKPGYLPCHLLFRTSEISLRLVCAVLLCECLRALILGPRYHTLFLSMPFALFVLVYTQVYAGASRSANRSPDSCLSSLVVAIVTLSMNPMHFFERPGFGSSVQKANKCLFITRAVEFCVTLSLVFWTGSQPLVQICTPISGLEMLMNLGPLVWGQLALSFAVHYLVMVLNSDINHSTCQRLSRATEQNSNAMVFTDTAGHNDLYVPPPPAHGGLCQAWVDIGGSLPFADFPQELPNKLVEYRLLKVLGSGSYGVVVKMQKVAEVEEGESKYVAVKLLNTQTRGQRALAHREAKLYTKIWRTINNLADDVTPKAEDLLPKAGHPFIVRLLFWSQWDTERNFFLENQQQVVSEATGTRYFSMALVMELCDSNLEIHLNSHFQRSEVWFQTLVHFLAEIQLALAFLHRSQMAYRDLKPENVLIVGPVEGQVHCKLADFGFARELDPDDEQEVKTFAGTPYYFAPEVETQKSREQAQENAVDVYSYGTLAYALGHGPGYVCEGNRMGNRTDHPRCHNGRNCQACAGCTNVSRLRENWAEQFREEAGRQLAELVESCVDNRPRQRPSIQRLQSHGLFEDVEFKRLLQLNI